MYHYNTETGVVGQCKAQKGRCPFIDASDTSSGHYETLSEIDEYLERKSSKDLSIESHDSSLCKTDFSSPESIERLKKEFSSNPTVILMDFEANAKENTNEYLEELKDSIYEKLEEKGIEGVEIEETYESGSFSLKIPETDEAIDWSEVIESTESGSPVKDTIVYTGLKNGSIGITENYQKSRGTKGWKETAMTFNETLNRNGDFQDNSKKLSKLSKIHL